MHLFRSPTYGFMVGAKGCRLDFNNGLGGDSNSGPILPPQRLFKSDSNNDPPQAIQILCLEIEYAYVQVSYLWFPGECQGLQAWLQ